MKKLQRSTENLELIKQDLDYKFQQINEKRAKHSLRYESLKKIEEDRQKKEIKKVIEESRNRISGLVNEGS